MLDVTDEIQKLIGEIKRLGSQGADGRWSVKYGVLVKDDRVANIFEALVGTLRAAKKRKIVQYDGELLLQGVHDNVDIVVLTETVQQQ
eukprot:jgi/Hompol1/5569/HPOL_000421-RA